MTTPDSHTMLSVNVAFLFQRFVCSIGGHV